MLPSLAVVTFTQRKYLEMTEQMLQSLVLPKGAVHHTIECEPHDYERKRWEARLLADWICFVDDDDLIINDSIRICWEHALQNPDLGVVFTAQQFISAHGFVIEDEILGSHGLSPVTYEDVARHSQAIHHLAMIRSAAIHPMCDKLAGAINTGTDWLMKGSAALGHGALHLPFYGYQWRQHMASQSKSDEWLTNFRANASLIQAFLHQNSKFTGRIPSAQ